MALPANRVSASRPPETRTSVSGAFDVATARRTTSSMIDRRSAAIADPDLHVAEARGRGAVPGGHDLHGFALAAVRQAPEHPAPGAAHGVARSPELGGRAAVGRVLDEAPALAVHDLPSVLGAELEVETPVVDAPRAVGVHENAVLRRRDDLFEIVVARKQAHVGHADEWEMTPPLGAHRAVAGAFADDRRGLARGEIALEHPLRDDLGAM